MLVDLEKETVTSEMRQCLAEQLGFRQIGSPVDPVDGPEDILALQVEGTP